MTTDTVPDLTSPEPLVACTRCGHYPCPFCGPTSCDDGVEIARRPRSAAEIVKWLARLELGNGMGPHALVSARIVKRFCDGCNATFPTEAAGARVLGGGMGVGTIVFWFCTEACARKWCAEDEVDFGQCPCNDVPGGCVYEDGGLAQNHRVMEWFWKAVAPYPSGRAGVNTLDSGHLAIDVLFGGRVPPFGRETVLYARCFRACPDFEIEVEPVGDGAGLLRWRVGLGNDARVRARGVTYLASGVALLRALRDAFEFLRRLREREARS